MIYLETNSNDPKYNLSFEEYAFNEISNIEDVFILWINKPCIVVGKNQNTMIEVNSEFCLENNIDIVRRVSGGGAVYHDLNNLNYTIITTDKSKGEFNFKDFSIPVIKALESIGIKATFTGRNDLEIDGRKFCGNAQHIKGNKIMHHGCIMFDVDTSVLEKALNVSKEKIESKGVKSVKARVTNIKEHLSNDITIFDFKDIIKKYMFEEYGLKDYCLKEEEKDEILKLKNNKHSSWEWVYGHNPECTLSRKKRLNYGEIEAKILLNGQKIENIKFYGDFFGVKDIDELSNKLFKTNYDKNSIYNILKDVKIEEYILGVTMDDLLDIIIE